VRRGGGRGGQGRGLLGLLCLLALLAPRGFSQQNPAAVAVPPSGSTFEGLASWYGAAFQGRRTSSGELFDKEGLTAAHRSLPFGTLLRVTDLASGGSVVVRVNDRGPFVGDRVLDLSEAAARLIGLLPEGTGRVSCYVLPPDEAASFGAPSPLPPATVATGPAEGQRTCRIQIASYREASNAAATLDRLRLSGIAATLEEAGTYRRVLLPAVPESEVPALLLRLKSLGYRNLLLSWSR